MSSTTFNRRRTFILMAIALVILPATHFILRWVPPGGERLAVYSNPSRFPTSPLRFKFQELVSPEPFPPRICHVQMVDFNDDGLMDVIACDARRGRVLWFQQQPDFTFKEHVLGDQIAAPAHATVVDFDKDGDDDIVVAGLGDILPTDAHVGSVILIENNNGKFQNHILLDDVRRVADVRAGDLDEDGDIDLAVAVFGLDHGRIIWLENKQLGNFQDHELLAVPGTVHVPIADFDQDGDLDIIALATQNEEQVWSFENVGSGKFKQRLVYQSANFDLGGAGLEVNDLDGDGDLDLLLTAGDNLEFTFHYPQPWHGTIWLENKGEWKFETKRIARFGGAYAASCGDLDGDGDRDVVLVSMFNDWNRDGAASVIWLENDGKQNFKSWQVANQPIRLCCVACGDLDGDGCDDIVAGGLRFSAPYDRIGRLPVWLSGMRKGI